MCFWSSAVVWSCPIAVLIVFFFWGDVWLFIFTLFSAQFGYLHLFRDLNRCFSSFCSWLGLEQTVLGLWYRVPITLYLDVIAWWHSQCRYWSVWVGFLYTLVLSLPSQPTHTDQFFYFSINGILKTSQKIITRFWIIFLEKNPYVISYLQSTGFQACSSHVTSSYRSMFYNLLAFSRVNGFVKAFILGAWFYKTFQGWFLVFEHWLCSVKKKAYGLLITFEVSCNKACFIVNKVTWSELQTAKCIFLFFMTEIMMAEFFMTESLMAETFLDQLLHQSDNHCYHPCRMHLELGWPHYHWLDVTANFGCNNILKSLSVSSASDIISTSVAEAHCLISDDRT